MYKTQPLHRILITLLAVLLTYALGVLMMIIAYAKPTDYRPPAAEYFIVPFLLGMSHPLVTGLALALMLTLVHICWHASLRRS